MPLLRVFRKKEAAVGEIGPLYPQVRSAMLDVQAYVRSHGTEIVLVGVSNAGDVTIQLTGAGHDAPVSGLTLMHGIKEQLKMLVPGVRRIVRAK